MADTKKELNLENLKGGRRSISEIFPLYSAERRYA